MVVVACCCVGTCCIFFRTCFDCVGVSRFFSCVKCTFLVGCGKKILKFRQCPCIHLFLFANGDVHREYWWFCKCYRVLYAVVGLCFFVIGICMMRPRYPLSPPPRVQLFCNAFAYNSDFKIVTFWCVGCPSILISVACGNTNVVALMSIDILRVLVGVRILLAISTRYSVDYVQ